MSLFRISLIVFVLISANSVLAAEDLNIESVPPVVVKTVPEAGSDNVDANLTEIKVTFSKKMTDGSWSWSTVTKDSFPTVTGSPKYLEDGRTCVLPVKLEPGKTYGSWLNSNKFGNFKDVDGRPAVPYLLVFKTKSTPCTTLIKAEVTAYENAAAWDHYEDGSFEAFDSLQFRIAAPEDLVGESLQVLVEPSELPPDSPLRTVGTKCTFEMNLASLDTDQLFWGALENVRSQSP